MTQDDLAELTRQTIHDAYAELATPSRKPYGMQINEANAAMLDGIVIALADFIMVGVVPNETSRAFATQWACDRLKTLVEVMQTKGAC